MSIIQSMYYENSFWGAGAPKDLWILRSDGEDAPEVSPPGVPQGEGR